jgi:hypothetical protein
LDQRGLVPLAHRFADLLRRVRDAHVEETLGESTWAVKARVGDLVLEGATDGSGQRIRYRRVNGRDLRPATLTINGMDEAAPIWNRLPGRP